MPQPIPYATFFIEVGRLLVSYQSIATLSYSYLPYDLRQHNLSMFWAVSLPSEWPFHCLVLHALMLLYGFYGNGHQSLVALGPCVWPTPGAAAACVWPTAAPPAMQLLSFLCGLGATIPLLWMAVAQVRARGELEAALAEAGVPLKRITVPLSWARTLACTLPDADWLLEGLRHIKNLTYARVPAWVAPVDSLAAEAACAAARVAGAQAAKGQRGGGGNSSSSSSSSNGTSIHATTTVTGTTTTTRRRTGSGGGMGLLQQHFQQQQGGEVGAAEGSGGLGGGGGGGGGSGAGYLPPPPPTPTPTFPSTSSSPLLLLPPPTFQAPPIKLKLDLWMPAAPTTPHTPHPHPHPHTPPYPVLMYIHGGAWTVGSRSGHSRPLVAELAQAGWVVACVSYRLAPRVSVRDMVLDCKEALWWLRVNVGRFGGDPEFICVGGESAGGHLASLLALTPGVRELAPPGVPPPLSHSLGVQGVCNLYGACDWVEFTGMPKAWAGGMSQFLGTFLIRSSLEVHPSLFVRASPLAWVRGKALPGALEAAGVALKGGMWGPLHLPQLTLLQGQQGQKEQEQQQGQQRRLVGDVGGGKGGGRGRGRRGSGSGGSGSGRSGGSGGSRGVTFAVEEGGGEEDSDLSPGSSRDSSPTQEGAQSQPPLWCRSKNALLTALGLSWLVPGEELLPPYSAMVGNTTTSTTNPSPSPSPSTTSSSTSSSSSSSSSKKQQQQQQQRALDSSDPLDLLRDMLMEDSPLPPFVLVHGDVDTVVPHSVSSEFWKALQLRRAREAAGSAGAGAGGLGRQSSPPTPPLDVFLSVRGAHHAFNFLFSPRTLAVGDAVVDTLNEVHARWREAGRGGGKLRI